MFEQVVEEVKEEEEEQLAQGFMKVVASEL